MLVNDNDLTDQYSVKLITKLDLMNLSSESKVDMHIIKKAMCLAKKYHCLQTRQSGEPFYSHTFAVAEKVSEYYFETDAINFVAQIKEISYFNNLRQYEWFEAYR